MKKLLKSIFKLINLFINLKLIQFINVKRNQFYSLWLSNEFKNKPSLYICFPAYVFGAKHVSIGENCNFGRRLRIEAYDKYLDDKYLPSIKIGDNVSIQTDCHIGAINNITIGNNVVIASKVYICDHSHGEINFESLKTRPALRKLFSKGPVIIKNNVWLGEGVVILPGVTIGENCIVGANSVVTKSFPSNCVLAGIPARIIKEIKYER